jgi:hypothetical protein
MAVYYGQSAKGELAQRPEEYPWLYSRMIKKMHRRDACATKEIEFVILKRRTNDEALLVKFSREMKAYATIMG